MFKKTIMMVAVLLWCSPAFGGHPLITDDAGTQGAGALLFELNGEYAKDSRDSTTEIAAAVTGGIGDNMDLVFSAPYQYLRSEDDAGKVVTEDGISDISVELKWRFYETEGFSLALKPGVTFPSGDDEKGLGDGKASYGTVLIATKEFAPAAVHMNLGFTKNRSELRDVWHYSVSAEYEMDGNLLLVGNIGGESNPDRGSDTHPVFLLGGLIYSVSDNIDIDLGFKTGLNSAEPDYTVLAGLAVTFGRLN